MARDRQMLFAFGVFFTSCLFLIPGALAELLDSVCYDDVESLGNVQIDSEVAISDFRNKAVLIINTASFCTFTHQFPGFNELQDEFGDNLIIIGFPCNQFGLQEPGVGEEILNTLRYVRPGNGYIPNFPLTKKKVEVNGPNAHQLFVELKNSCPPVKMEIGDPASLYWSPMRVGDITWNFNKFLLDRNGLPFKRYDSSVEPEQLRADIEMVVQGLSEQVERPQRPKYARDDL